ncbi:Arm DNA-binding domain-containing protein [Hansschlegelia beijingensis]|uniref:Arm DNA-binding domain-containing protein n=1 Tax=Hansschlegelia beijingensis TaxID=1133344 RepID=UPI00160958C6
MALSDTKLRAIRPTGKRREIADQNGLSLRVSQRGVMTWTATFRLNKGGGGSAASAANRRRMALGEYPTVSLAEARQRTLEIKRMAPGWGRSLSGSSS